LGLLKAAWAKESDDYWFELSDSKKTKDKEMALKFDQI